MEKIQKTDAGENPDAALTREQVMAQRAEKKKLKEARKNKSAANPVGGGEDSSTSNQKQQVPKSKKPQQQPSDKSKEKQQQQPSDKSKEKQQQQLSDTVKEERPTSRTPKAKTPQETIQTGKTAKQQQRSQAFVPTATDISESGEKTAATPSEGSAVSAITTTSTDKAISASVTNVTVDDSKAGTPDRVLGLAKPGIEFHSTIQSLFKVKKVPELTKDKKFQLDPLFHSLGVKLRHDVIRGTNQRCVALLHTIKDYVMNYEAPSGMSFKHGISSDLKLSMDALRRKCPFAIGMNNAVEFLNAFLCKMEQDVGDIPRQKEEILDVIDQYIEEKIEKAVEAIVFYGDEKHIIRTGDVVMIYSLTEAALNLLAKMAEKFTFELILIQTPEVMLDIPVLLKKLSEPISQQRITISSVNFSNAIYKMRHCTKVLIGGHGLFTTGGVMAQSGSGKLALLASTYNKPTIFLCETYKFCDRSPLDFFTLDEYIPEKSFSEEDLFEPKIKYDITPANLVTVVITDIDMLPSTSVPVVLRVQEGRVSQQTDEGDEILN